MCWVILYFSNIAVTFLFQAHEIDEYIDCLGEKTDDDFMYGF